MALNTKSLLSALLVTIGVLFIPFIAMQFSEQVNWTPGDFVVAGLLIFGAAVVLLFALSSTKNRRLRIAFIIGVVAMLLLAIAELGVGVFGTPFAGN